MTVLGALGIFIVGAVAGAGGIIIIIIIITLYYVGKDK